MVHRVARSGTRLRDLTSLKEGNIWRHVIDLLKSLGNAITIKILLPVFHAVIEVCGLAL